MYYITHSSSIYSIPIFFFFKKDSEEKFVEYIRTTIIKNDLENIKELFHAVLERGNGEVVKTCMNALISEANNNSSDKTNNNNIESILEAVLSTIQSRLVLYEEYDALLREILAEKYVAQNEFILAAKMLGGNRKNVKNFMKPFIN